MSTQLILYPQNYKGYLSTFTAGPQAPIIEFIVDGVNFTSINASSSVGITYGASFPPSAVLTQQPPLIYNTWYRFRSTQSGLPALPVQTGNDLVLNSVHLSTSCGVYQKLSNLSPGAIYKVTVNIDVDATDTTGELWAASLNPSFPYSTIWITQNTSVLVSQFIGQFTAQSTQDVIMIWYRNEPGFGNSKDLTIKDISVSLAEVPLSGVYSDLQDGQVICDLYQEEDIPLTLSIDNFKNVAEKVQSYSKDFNLPATKRNNQIFNNMFEITRADDGLIFNPYIKTQCVLKQDGVLLFEGYLRMIDIKDKEGEISYNVNLYSEVIALADTLKDRTFSDLDLSELRSDYEYDNIRDSWNDAVGLPLINPITSSSFAYDSSLASPFDHTNVMKYPFIDWNHQFYLDTNGNPVMPNLNSAFRPCIQVKYLINKIFSEAGFTWTSDFFDTANFGKLFIDFNWGNDENPTDISNSGSGFYQPSNFPTNNFATSSWKNVKVSEDYFSDEMGYDVSTGIFTVPVGQGDTTYTINYTVQFLFLNYESPADLEMRWSQGVSGGYIYFDQDSVAAGDVTGSATAYSDINNSGHITAIDVATDQGGYYTSEPTVIISTSQGASGAQGNNATAEAVCAVLPGPVTSVTITDPGTGYQTTNHPYIEFEGVTKGSCVYTYTGTFTRTLEDGDTLQCQFRTPNGSANSVMQDNRENANSFHRVYNWRTAWFYGSVSIDTVASAALLNALRGDLGQWDFLKGIMTMFNLVSLADDTNKNNIFIEPYSDVFIKHSISNSWNDQSLASRSIEHDWTDKVDVSQMELKPLTDLNKKTIFKFVEDDDDYCFNAYKMATAGGLYGAKYWDASAFTILEGEEEITAEPFAATVIKPLQSGLTDFIVPSIYSVDESGESDGFDNSPRILYNNGVKTLAYHTYTVPAQNATPGVTDEDEFLQFSHLSTIPITPTTVDFNFESDQLIQPLDINGMPTNNLFYTYWLPYFAELYSPDTRVMTLKVNLSPSDIASFKFYDRVFIKNRVFRVNKIEYKPNSLAKVEFILIGS